MKKIKIILYFVIVCLSLQACKKDSPGDNYDFSNSLPPYVTLTSKTVSATAGGSANVAINVRTALEQDVIITYNVSGGITLSNQTVTLKKETYTVNAVVPVPAGTGTAKLTIVKAVKADGSSMTIGQDNVAANQVATITWK